MKESDIAILDHVLSFITELNDEINDYSITYENFSII
jgi:hypothetical protein